MTSAPLKHVVFIPGFSWGPCVGRGSEDTVVLIDALDECDDPEQVGYFPDQLAQWIEEFPLKFLVTSRPEAWIHRKMRPTYFPELARSISLHDMDEATVKADIKLYLEQELASISLSDKQLVGLAEQFGSLFIYAATLVRRPEGRQAVCAGYRKVDYQLDEEHVKAEDVGEKDEQGGRSHTGGLEPRQDFMGADDEVVFMVEKEPEKEAEPQQEPGTLTRDDVPGTLTTDNTSDLLHKELSPDDPASLAKNMLRPDAEATEATLADLDYISSIRDNPVQYAMAPSLSTSRVLPALPFRIRLNRAVLIPWYSSSPAQSLYTGLSDSIDPDPTKQEKRPEESMTSVSSGKLVHAPGLMDVKPVLVGALDPVRHLFKNQWLGSKFPAVECPKEVGSAGQDTPFTRNYLFEADRKADKKAVCRRPGSGMTHSVPAHVPTAPRDTQAQPERLAWTLDDGALPKSICDGYPNSWTLTADVLN
ncbi:unnamed protein product [Rhizoctonia solani]|uniref:NACHT domain-containing protein n=1 Tax=Rhizoctonia solani TaxID=456999 RepID=A0A8H3I6J4_9AGAM|nr:unnamed protein product [Rhizoctonia solani]